MSMTPSITTDPQSAAMALPAQMVYGVWRRILREAPLAEAMFDDAVDDAALARRFALSAPECAAVRAYAATPKPTRMFILNYRFRMVGSVQNALESAAPLTYRAIKGAGLDLKALATEFLDRDGWRDDGPFVVGYCARVLDFLADAPATAQPAGLRDLIALDRATAGLIRSLADRPQAAAPDDGRLHVTGRAVAVETAHDLSPWLRSTARIGQDDLPAKPSAYLSSMPDLAASPKLSGLPLRAAHILAALDAGPVHRQGLRQRLADAGHPQDTPQDDALIARLAERGAIAGHAA